MARVSACFPWDEIREHLEIALSEHDLIMLLTLLYEPGAAKGIVCTDVPPEYTCARIRVEPDEQHYAHPGREGVCPASVNPLETAVESTIDAVIRRYIERGGTRPPLEWLDGGEP